MHEICDNFVCADKIKREGDWPIIMNTRTFKKMNINYEKRKKWKIAILIKFLIRDITVVSEHVPCTCVLGTYIQE